MNIIHFIEKIPFLELVFFEKIARPYFVVLYLIDVFCCFKTYRYFKEPLWQCFIPFYNLKVYFERCWNLEAFREHLCIEILGLMIPLFGRFIQNDILLSLLSVLEFVVSCLAMKHGFEIGTCVLRSYGYDVRKYLWSIFIFDIF